jgi:hypothetical protein
VALAMVACGGDDAAADTDATTTVATSTGVADDGSGVTSVDPSTDGSSSGGPVGSSGAGSSEGGDTTSGSSGSDGCTPGTEGCPCDAGDCDPELSCVGDVCVAAVCDVDVNEPNDDENSATVLGDVGSNNGNGSRLTGTLGGLGDVDWYRYSGSDDINGAVDPARTLTSTVEVRMCKFLECNVGLPSTEFECPAGTDYALSPGARSGCCVTGDAAEIAVPDLNCAGVVSDDAEVFIRIDQPAAECANYGVAYHY